MLTALTASVVFFAAFEGSGFWVFVLMSLIRTFVGVREAQYHLPDIPREWDTMIEEEKTYISSTDTFGELN